MRHVGDPSLGAIYLGNNRCLFRVWAPRVARVQVRLLDPDGRVVGLEPRPFGYHQAVVEDVAPGTKYFYRLDEQRERPDPASRRQPPRAGWSFRSSSTSLPERPASRPSSLSRTPGTRP